MLQTVFRFTIFILLTSVGGIALASPAIDKVITVCPSSSNDMLIPDFTAEKCEETSFYQANPQDRQIWLRASLTISEASVNADQPLGVFLSGKASSQIFLNGSLIGENGVPSTTKHNEVAGKMDFVVFAKPTLLKQGDNELVIRMSGHHGFLRLATPLHTFAVRTYVDPTLAIFSYYWPSLIPLGVLLLGAVYFGVLGFRQRQSATYFMLPLMAIIAASQLIVEVLRGFYAYPYPMHDVRLVLILACSVGFGLSLLAYTLSLSQIKYRKIVFLATATITIIGIILTPGFDYKSATGLGFPCLTSLGACLVSVSRKQKNAIALLIGILIFIVTVVATPGKFLDIYFFYIVACFVFFLFIQQLKMISKEQQERVLEKARADKLQLIIDQHQLNTGSPTLSVRSSNKTELVAIAEIAYCKGAGDYVELVLNDGSKTLHSDSLTDLETSLPSTFLRVHRSYIVNTSMIESIERKKSGVGSLRLRGVDPVPVSRRIMPSVREKLARVNT